MRLRVFRPLRLVATLILGAGVLFWSGCDTTDPVDDTGEDEPLRQVSYELTAQENDGELPEGIDGEVTFWEINSQQTLITIELAEGETGLNRAHPAHIHNNNATEGGEIALYLSPIDGTAGDASSARVVNAPIDSLTAFNGYVNVHESVGNLENVISQGNIGDNADGTESAGLELVNDMRSTPYDLEGRENEGTLVPQGISGSAIFQELTEDQTLVTVSLDDTTGAEVGHAVHLRDNSMTEGGDTQYVLSPIDGTDPAARSSKILDLPYDSLATYDGYLNVYESVANQNEVITQGNIGANANGN